MRINLTDVAVDRRLRYGFDAVALLLAFDLILAEILTLIFRLAAALRRALVDLKIACPIDAEIFESADERRRWIFDQSRLTASRRCEDDLHAWQRDRPDGRGVKTKRAIGLPPHRLEKAFGRGEIEHLGQLH